MTGLHLQPTKSWAESTEVDKTRHRNRTIHRPHHVRITFELVYVLYVLRLIDARTITGNWIFNQLQKQTLNQHTPVEVSTR